MAKIISIDKISTLNEKIEFTNSDGEVLLTFDSNLNKFTANENYNAEDDYDFVTVKDIVGSSPGEDNGENGDDEDDSIRRRISINGSVFITDIIPTSDGNVGGKIFSSNGKVLDECVTNNQFLTIHVLALPGNSNYKPKVTILSQEINLVEQNDRPLFIGSIDIDLGDRDRITVIHEDGARHTVLIGEDSPIEIETAHFIGDYPSNQIELKENDFFDFYIEANEPFIKIEVDNFEAFKANVIELPEASSQYTFTGTIANRGTTAQDQRARVRIQKETGAWSDWFTTEIGENGTDHVILNNLFPSISIDLITYPGTQQALKDAEEATISYLYENADVVSVNLLPVNGSNQLNIVNHDPGNGNTIVNRIAGGYNISTNNFRFNLLRYANGAILHYSLIVQIAHDDPQIVTSTWTQIRSGLGSINVNSNFDQLVKILNIELPINRGTLTSPSSVANFSTSYNGGISATDSDIHNNENVNMAIQTENLAGKLNTLNRLYIIRGFAEKSLTLTYDDFILPLGINVVEENNFSISGRIDNNPPFPIVQTQVNSIGELSLADQWCFTNLDLNEIQIAEEVVDFGYAPGINIIINIEEI